MKNTACLILPLLFIFSCKKHSETIVGKEVQAMEKSVGNTMNDASWRADSTIITKHWSSYWKNDNIRPDSAIYYCRQIIELAEPVLSYRFDSSLYTCYAKAFGGIGFNLTAKGRLDEGLSYTMKSFDLFTRQFGEAHIRNTELCVGVSSNYAKRGDFEQAVVWQKKALSIMERLFPDKRHYYFGNILSNIGFFHLLKGDHVKALEYYLQVLKRSKEIPEEKPRLPLAMIRVAMCKAMANKKAEAIHYLKLSDNSKEESLSQMDTSERLDYLIFLEGHNAYISGLAYANSGEYASAKNSLNKLIHIIRDHPTKLSLLPFMGLSYLELGKIEKKQQNWHSARNFFRKSLQFWEESRGFSEMINTDPRIEIADTYLLEGKTDSSILEYQRALHFLSPAFSESSPDKIPQINNITPSIHLLTTLTKKGKAMRFAFHHSKKINDLSRAFSTLSLATDLADKMRTGYKWQSSKQSLSERILPIFENAICTALDLYEKTGENRFKDEAFTLTERSKAFLLMENLRQESARHVSGIPSGLLEQEEKINRDIATYERFILEENQFKEKPDTSSIYYWNSKLAALKLKQDSLISILEKNYPDYYRVRHESVVATLSGVQQALKKEETLVSYFLGDSSLITFAINPAGSSVLRQKVDSSFLNAVNDFHQFAGQPGNDDNWQSQYQQFITNGRHLYQILIEPHSPTLSSLIIIPDGILSYLPFNLLLTMDPSPDALASFSYRNLPYLVNDHNIRYEYSATLLLDNQSARSKIRYRARQLPYCGFAPSYGDGESIASRGTSDSLKIAELFSGLTRSKLGALPHTVQEVEASNETMKGRIFKAGAATETAFKKQAGKANILHLAMHALTNDADPLFSQLVFTQTDSDTTEDGRLHAYELYNMHLNADLAVLSACNTGAGKLHRGEGVMSLSRAFKYAGCPNVVMSLWKADDYATSAIVTDFFSHLQVGVGKDEALCRAQRDFVHTTSKEILTHPYYWSALILMGDGAPLAAGGISWWMWVVGICLLAGMSALIFWWRK